MSSRYKKPTMGEQLRRSASWLALIIYLAGLLTFLAAELGFAPLAALRATDQRIIIFVLLFLPFVLPAAISAVQKLSLKISGQELQLEMRETQEKMDGVAGQFSLQIGNAEAIFAPMLGGPDSNHSARLARREIVVGAKGSPSAELLGEILAVRIESCFPDVTVVRRIPNGSTLRNLVHLQQGWIDLYVEFTGTGCGFHNLDHRNKTPEQLRQEVNALSEARYGARWLKLWGLRDNYCVAMRAERASELNITNLSDLARLSPRLTFAGYVEFLNRSDGFDGLKHTYDMEFARVYPRDINDLFDDLDNGSADAIVSQESDPELFTETYVTLEDDLAHFPDYHAAPVVRSDALNAITGLEDCLNGLVDKIDTVVMCDLVRQRMIRGDDPAIRRDIARKFIEKLE